MSSEQAVNRTRTQDGPDVGSFNYFKISIINMLNDIVETVGNMCKQMKNLIKEIKPLKKNKMECWKCK